MHNSYGASRGITPSEFENLAFGHNGRKQRFHFPWSDGLWQTRIIDDWNPATGTMKEATLLRWGSLNLNDVHSVDFQRFTDKLKQAAQDGWLLKHDAMVKQVVWYGQEALPATGRASELTRLLTQNGIDYKVVIP